MKPIVTIKHSTYYVTWIAFISMPLWANDIVDVHGVDALQARQILQRYEKPIQTIETQFSELFLASQKGIDNTKQTEALYLKKLKLIDNIKTAYHFTFVDIQTVSYPNKEDIYTTIEIIPSSTAPGLHYVNQKKSFPKPPIKHDLIDEMMTYYAKAMRLFLTKQLDLTDQHCPVYHCAVPFNHPELTPYLAVFNQGIKQHKTAVIDTLSHDPNPDRRAAAAFLIGHLKDPHEIVTILSAHITDTNEGVRNNVLRVIGETIWRAKINDIDARPYMALLDSPYVTDRNKSLIILCTLANSPSGKKQIIENNHGKLETLAALKQPNNHDMALKILKKINTQTVSKK